MILAYLTNGVDVNVVLSLLRMWHKRLHKEVPQVTLNVLDLLHLVCAGGDPISRLLPCCVKLQKTRLASSLDELIWLCNEFRARNKEEWVFGLSSVKDALDVVSVLKSDARKLGWWVVC